MLGQQLTLGHYYGVGVMHEVNFLQDLAVVMIAAGIVTLLFQRLKQPVVLGYIVAGILIGPNFSALFLEEDGFRLVHDRETIESLAELGMVFLMFSLGLEFNLRKLGRVAATALVAAPLAIMLMVFLGYQVGQLMGWTPVSSLFLGAIISIASTSVIVKVLKEMKRDREPFTELIYGILIVEDLLGVVMIVLLTGIASTGDLGFQSMLISTGKLLVFLVTVPVVGLLLIPRLLNFVARFESNERLLVAVLGLCFGTALVAAKLGFSVALGAFLVGAVMAESSQIHRIESLVEPVRDLFTAVFFVAIGLLVDPVLLWKHIVPIVGVSIVVIVGQVLGNTFGTVVAGHDLRTAVRVGTGLSQIGEFSFVIATLGLTLGVTDPSLYPIVIGVALVTTVFTPSLIRCADGVTDHILRTAPKPLVGYLALYKDWVERFKGGQWNSLAWKLSRKWILQMAINMLLVAGIILGAAYLARLQPVWLTKWNLKLDTLRTVLWGASLIFSLPMIIANLRKLQALGMLISEATVSHNRAGERTQSLRAVVANACLIAGTTGMILSVTLLSSALLPPLKIMLALMVVVAVVAWLQWRFLVRVYARAQIAIKETLESHEISQSREVEKELLRAAHLERVCLNKGSAVLGQAIAVLRLREKTGVSIVGIERDGERILNPGGGEVILEGDVVLLLGEKDQLEQARAKLNLN
ncbi:MAG: cation:proton antiporter [Verrucomicrobiota bacterium]|nr:cation:proton antiporter [Verrucomicrobiota bacterium]